MFRLGKKIFVKGPRPPPSAIARNCYGYAAGGMPLAFTQEDFLVTFCIAQVIQWDLFHMLIHNFERTNSFVEFRGKKSEAAEGQENTSDSKQIGI